jgi:hypothetical protein
MVEQAKLTHTLLDMIGYGHIVMCIYPHSGIDHMPDRIDHMHDRIDHMPDGIDYMLSGIEL